MFNIYLGIFIVAAIGIIAGGTFKLFGSERKIAAIIFLIGAIAAFVVFGIRWFGSGKDSMLVTTPVQWPPMVNTCPDYLMYYKRPKTDGTYQDTCVDKLGVSRNGSLKIFPADSNVNNANDEYFFSLITADSDPDKRKAELCQRAIQYGLTWEGITNGESCITSGNKPVSPSGGSSGNGCPS
jgi:hypothetical protein